MLATQSITTIEEEMTAPEKLIAVPTVSATTPLDPNVPIPANLVNAHRAMLALYDVADDWFATDCELVRCSMLIQHWKAVTGLGAHLHEPHKSILRRPGRATLVDALRVYESKAIFAAYRACCEYDGLAEIAEAWRSVVTAFGAA